MNINYSHRHWSESSNRPFPANDHVVQNPPCWRASSLLFLHCDIKTKASQASLVPCFNVPVRINNELALQHGGFCTTWSLVAKGLLCQCILRALPSQAEHLTQKKFTHRYHHLLTIQPPMVTDITTYWPDQHHRPQVIAATDHTNTTGHVLTIQPRMFTGITTYWLYHPNCHRYYHLLIIPPPMVTGITTQWPHNPN